jgi:hypothetical protein
MDLAAVFTAAKEFMAGGIASTASFADDRRRANDAYVKSASAERDRLLNTQIKSICRGC